MAISFVEKLAYINKYAKGDEKLIKAVKYGRSIDKIDDEDKKKKIKEIVNKAFDNIKKINTEKEGAKKTNKPSQAVVEAKQKIDDEIEKFKKSIGRTKWLTATRYMTQSGLKKTTIEKDAKVGALPKGKRISRKTGKPYWENRANRSDVKQPPVDYPKLAKGGEIGKFNGKPFSFYKYDTKKVKIAWKGKIQPFGAFYSVEDAIEELKKHYQTQQELREYSIVTPDGIIHYGKEYPIRYAKGGGVGSYKSHKVGDEVEVWQFGGKSKMGKIVGFEDGDIYILQYEDGSKSYTPKKYIANLSGEFPYMMAKGGKVEYDRIDQRMYNFLEEDLATLEQSIKEDDKEKIEQFFSYWTGNDGHLKSLETKSNQRMYNFLEDDLATLEQSIIKNDNEKIEQFFSYWGQHLNSIKYAKGGEVDNWKEFYEMSKDTSAYNPEYEKKFGSYKYQAPHIQEILSNSKSFEDFMNRKKRFEQSKNSDASQNYWGKMDRRSKKAWLLMSGFNESDSNDLLSKQWDGLSNGQKAKLTRGLIKQGDNKSSVFFSEYEIESDKFANGGTTPDWKFEIVTEYSGGVKSQPIYVDTLEEVEDFVLNNNDYKSVVVTDTSTNKSAIFTQQNKNTSWLKDSIQRWRNNRAFSEAIREKYPNRNEIPMSFNFSNGGEVEEKVEISNFRRNILGTLSFDLKLKRMRKPQDFVVYPAQEKTDYIIIQSNSRFGKIEMSTGRGLMSQSHPNGAYAYHYQMDKKDKFQLSDDQLSELKKELAKTAGSEVGIMGVISDNTYANQFADGGQIGSGKNGYVAFYKGKRIEVYADTMYQAQQLAVKHFKAKKEWEVNVVLAEVDGKPYIQSTAFAKGGNMEGASPYNSPRLKPKQKLIRVDMSRDFSFYDFVNSKEKPLYNLFGVRNGKEVKINKNPMSEKEADEMYDDAKKSGLYSSLQILSDKVANDLYSNGGEVVDKKNLEGAIDFLIANGYANIIENDEGNFVVSDLDDMDDYEVEYEPEEIIYLAYTKGYNDDEIEDYYEYAKGGIVEHGLEIGDTIVYWARPSNVIQVQSQDGVLYWVNLNSGQRLLGSNYTMDNYEKHKDFFKK